MCKYMQEEGRQTSGHATRLEDTRTALCTTYQYLLLYACVLKLSTLAFME